MIFQQSTNTQAYLKMGLMGFAGDGKTFTASEVAIGLVNMMRERGIEKGSLPVAFLDTETGSDWVAPRFKAEQIDLVTAKTRAFQQLIPAIKEAEKNNSVLIIDSITHFWRELTESYAKKRNRRAGLLFQDWAWLKQQWGQFTDIFINSQCHIIMCGRAGYEYDFFENEGGKKELEKTGVKMKAETETGYEPSILVLMEKHRDIASGEAYRTGSILKDRADLIDGKVFKNPCFEDFLPHINFLNIGGSHLGIGSENSESMVPPNGKEEWQIEKEQKEIVLDEIKSLLVKHYPGQSAEDKKTKAELLDKFFGTASWKRLETFSLATVKDGFSKLSITLEES